MWTLVSFVLQWEKQTDCHEEVINGTMDFQYEKKKRIRSVETDIEKRNLKMVLCADVIWEDSV